ncbi:MAG: hypothetical protein EBQ88_01600 [Betaproteobacteria bacterium]|nr:hypothetical protein [Betaproteobacteria bacterium]
MTAESSIELLDQLRSDFEQLAESLRKATRVRVLEDDVQEALYGVAYTALSGRQYGQAGSLFAFLAAQRPMEARYLSGLGTARAGQGEHLQAVMAFSLASHFDPANPRHLLNLAESMLSIGEPAMARHALKAVESVAAENPEHAPLVQRAQALLRLVRHAVATSPHAPSASPGAAAAPTASAR